MSKHIMGWGVFYRLHIMDAVPIAWTLEEKDAQAVRDAILSRIPETARFPENTRAGQASQYVVHPCSFNGTFASIGE